jgi:hypothetical protein
MESSIVPYMYVATVPVPLTVGAKTIRLTTEEGDTTT